MPKDIDTSIINPARPVAATEVTDELKERTRTQLILRAVEFLNRSDLGVLGHGAKFRFGHDPASLRPTVALVDETTNVVLCQLPPEGALRMAADLRRRLARQNKHVEIKDGFGDE